MPTTCTVVVAAGLVLLAGGARADCPEDADRLLQDVRALSADPALTDEGRRRLRAIETAVAKARMAARTGQDEACERALAEARARLEDDEGEVVGDPGP